MSLNGTERRLVLLRHAKSAWPHGVPDHDRPLTGKGRRTAQAIGERLVSDGWQLDLVLCSDALRAVQTWEIVARVLPRPPRVRATPALYGADVQALLAAAALAAEPAGAAGASGASRPAGASGPGNSAGRAGAPRTVMVVGHEPTLSSTALALAGPGSDPGAVMQVNRKYPTGGLAVLRFHGPWSGLRPGGAVLESFTVPRPAQVNS